MDDHVGGFCHAKMTGLLGPSAVPGTAPVVLRRPLFAGVSENQIRSPARGFAFAGFVSSERSKGAIPVSGDAIVRDDGILLTEASRL